MTTLTHVTYAAQQQQKQSLLLQSELKVPNWHQDSCLSHN